MSNPEIVTGNLRKAEQYGAELVREDEFWTALGVRLTAGYAR